MDKIALTCDPTFQTKADVTIQCGDQKVVLDIPDELIFKLPIDQKRLVVEVMELVARGLSGLEVKSTFIPPPPKTESERPIPLEDPKLDDTGEKEVIKVKVGKGRAL